MKITRENCTCISKFHVGIVILLIVSVMNYMDDGQTACQYRDTKGTPEKEDDVECSYTYNEDGTRTSKTVNGVTTKFSLDGTRIIEQESGANPLHFLYDRNDEIIGFDYCGQTYYYLKNLQGDVTALIDDEGFLMARYEYDDWGKCTVITDGVTRNNVANVNPFRYRGYYFDTETGLYYLQSRYYDPETGRFINCDDVNYIGVNGTVS